MDNQLSTEALIVIAASGGVGALVAGLFSFWGSLRNASMQTDREHHAWLRQEKYKAYAEVAHCLRGQHAYAWATRGGKTTADVEVHNKENAIRFSQVLIQVGLLMETHNKAEFRKLRDAFGVEVAKTPIDKEQPELIVNQISRLLRKDLDEVGKKPSRSQRRAAQKLLAARQHPTPSTPTPP